MPSDPATCEDILDLLELEPLDRDLYRARNERRPGFDTLYGGQVAAQCLRAAGDTVPEGRRPHSLHGYFLRPGRPEWPVLLEVHRDRDGRSFSARRVEARQQGEVIFSMSASWQAPEEAPAWVPDAPSSVPGPDDLAPSVMPWLNHALMEMRPVQTTEDWANAQLWVRVRATLPPLAEDPLLHACALTYLSDMGTGFADVGVDGLPYGGPSLDHALWLHEPIAADDWVLVDLAPMVAGGARGLYRGGMWDAAGTLGAMLTQEMLLRG